MKSSWFDNKILSYPTILSKSQQVTVPPTMCRTHPLQKSHNQLVTNPEQEKKKSQRKGQKKKKNARLNTPKGELLRLLSSPPSQVRFL